MGKKDAGIIRLPCDDLATQEGGWVEMCAYLQIRHLPYVDEIKAQGFTRGWKKLRESERGNKILALRYEFLAIFVTDWDWKDAEGNPYPKPADNVKAFPQMRPIEHKWLWDKVWEIIGGSLGIPKANDTPL